MFNSQLIPVVGFVAQSGEVLQAIVNGVSESGNPDLAVIQQVPDATYDQNQTPGTWHYLPGTEPPIEEAEAPIEEAEAPIEEPQSEEPSEPA